MEVWDESVTTGRRARVADSLDGMVKARSRDAEPAIPPENSSDSISVATLEELLRLGIKQF